MSQSDYNIENADGATVRADINSQLEAIGSTNSGSTAPPVTFPYMRWHDTANAQLKERNGANTAWIVVADIVAGELVPHSAGESADSRYARLSGGADANFTAMPQVGGDPVVESGSNSDGEWTRWADGTQITKTVGVGSGSGFVSKTLPAAYVSADYVVTGSVDVGTSSDSSINVSDRTTTSATIAVVTNGSFSGGAATIWGTQGRWK